MENTLKLTLSPPWYTYHHKVMALFGSDPDIRVRDLEKVSDNEYSYMMLIGSQDKAEAIKKILPGEVPIGDVTVRAAILGPDEDGENSAEEIASVCDLFRKAFTGNPHFSRVVTVRYPPGMVLNYCVLKKEIIQFWNDDLSDINGVCSMITSELAREILVLDSALLEKISFCIEAD